MHHRCWLKDQRANPNRNPNPNQEELPPHPTMRLVTYQRWERRRDVQRQMVLRTMAQARHSE